MKIIVNESQYKKLLFEETSKNGLSKLKELKTFFNDLMKNVKKQIGLDLGFLATWGGFMRPIAEFMEGNYPDLTQTEIALLSTGIILTYYQSNKELLRGILIKIKENGLIQEFNHMLEKSEHLKNAFINFISSLGVPVARIANMMAYTFLIPLIPELYEIAQGYGQMELKEFTMRIIMYLGITFMGNLIRSLIGAIVTRFKS